MKKITVLLLTLTCINTSFGMLTKTPTRTIVAYKQIKSFHTSPKLHNILGVLHCPCKPQDCSCGRKKPKEDILLNNRVLKIRRILKTNNFNNTLENLWCEDRGNQSEVEEALLDLDCRNDDIIDLLNRDISDIQEQIDLLKEQQFLGNYLEIHKICAIEKKLHTTFDIEKDNNE